MALERTVGPAKIVLVQGDITAQEVDVIVNAANSALAGGGGVDGAIHRAGGPQILEECRAIARRDGGCPAGSSVVTSAGRLKARYVVHAVGPVWRGGGRNEDEQLRGAYASSLRHAFDLGIRSVAFPCISTGAYSFPPDRAARIAWDTVSEFLRRHGRPEEVRFVVYGDADRALYARLFEAA